MPLAVCVGLRTPKKLPQRIAPRRWPVKTWAKLCEGKTCWPVKTCKSSYIFFNKYHLLTSEGFGICMILQHQISALISCFQLSRCFKVLDVSATEVVTSCGLRLQGPTTAAVRLRKAVDSLLQKVPAQVGPGPCDVKEKDRRHSKFEPRKLSKPKTRLTRSQELEIESFSKLGDVRIEQLWRSRNLAAVAVIGSTRYQITALSCLDFFMPSFCLNLIEQNMFWCELLLCTKVEGCAGPKSMFMATPRLGPTPCTDGYLGKDRCVKTRHANGSTCRKHMQTCRYAEGKVRKCGQMIR